MTAQQAIKNIRALLAEIEAQQVTYRQIIDMHQKRIGELDIQYVHLLEQLDKIRELNPC